MIKSSLVNVLCGNELITAEIVDEEENLYRSLNITIGEVNIFDIIETKKENGMLVFVAVREEGVPHKEFFNYKNQKDWATICNKAASVSDKCIIQPLAAPKGSEPGIAVIAYDEGFDPKTYFGDIIQSMANE